MSISDPRSPFQVRHDRSKLLTVAACAVLCSGNEFTDIEVRAKERIVWLRGFLMLEHGPSHDTFGPVFGALEPREFEAAFPGRVEPERLIPALGKDGVVANDGKSRWCSTTNAAPGQRVACQG